MFTNDTMSYDETDPRSIESYGKRMIGKTFSDICKEDNIEDSKVVAESIDYDSKHADKKRKGGLGELVEERFFHYQANGENRADFDKAGVELKVTPYKINKNGSISAKERLVLTMIDYFTVVNEKFEESHLWTKSKLILLVYYLFRQEIEDRLNYQIDYVQLFTPPKEDMSIIKHDFLTIQDKIKVGKAHELSESDTLYLSACPKGSSSKDRRKQPNSDELAMPRAFAYKSSYMTYVLNHYIVPGKDTYESILKGEINEPFEKYVVDKIDQYRGYTVEDLCVNFGIEISDQKKKPKNLESMLAFRMLGIKGNNAEEFVKANIVVKSIRVSYDNKIRENMSFPTFKFKELIQEEWNDSTLGNYLRETRFLFVVFKFDDQERLHLMGCQFWNIPYEDLENHVKKVWERTKKTIEEGVQIKIINGIHYNNLPSSTEDPVCHVRPHAQNANDTYELPDGRQMTKQCFWLNKSYILQQLDPTLYKEREC